MSYTRWREGHRNAQDGTETHVWGELTYDPLPIIKVRGTDTKDEEAEVLYVGSTSFKLKKDADSEVTLLGTSHDTMQKQAVLTPPKDKQRRYPEGHGGIQHATDPEVSLTFSDRLSHITKNKFGVGKDGEFEVREKEAYFRVKTLIVDGELYVNKKIWTPEITEGSKPPPKFVGNEQEPKKQQGGGGSKTAQFEAAQLDLFAEQLELPL